MKFLHFSDLHLCKNRSDLLYGINPTDRLVKALRHVQQFHKDANFLVITGDLANYGEKSAYEDLSSIFENFSIPVIIIPGNHDNPKLIDDIFPIFDGKIQDLKKGIWLGKEIRSEKDCFIFLDSTGGVGHSGAFPIERAQDLDRRLTENADRHIYLFLHHPPLCLGVPSMDPIRLQDPFYLQSVIEKHRSQIRCLFMGHLHRPIKGSWRGIPFVIVRSLAHQVEMNEPPKGDGGQWQIPGNDETPEYNVITIQKENFYVHSERFLEKTRKFWL